MKALTLVMLTLVLAMGREAAFADPKGPAGPIPPLVSDHRIRSLLYEPSQVVRVRGWVGYHIDLEFEAGESFVMLGGGDLDGLTYGAYENHLVIKPRAAPVRTNLTVITTHRTYILDYAVEEGAPDPGSDELVYSLRFTYPAIAARGGAQRLDEELKQGQKERPKNTNYWFGGDSSLQPVAAFDDGVHTWIRFSPRAEIPALFVRNDDGTESLLNYNIDEGDVIIQRTVRRLVLRRGKLTGCVVNMSYSGAGERLDSGTVSPHVERTQPEGRP